MFIILSHKRIVICIITLFTHCSWSCETFLRMADSWLLIPVLHVVHNARSDRDGDTELFQDTENMYAYYTVEQ